MTDDSNKDASSLKRELDDLKEHLDAFFRESETFGVYRVVRDSSSEYLARTVLVSPSVSKLLDDDPNKTESWFSPIHIELKGNRPVST